VLGTKKKKKKRRGAREVEVADGKNYRRTKRCSLFALVQTNRVTQITSKLLS